MWVCLSKHSSDSVHTSISGIFGTNITCTMLCSSVFVVLVALLIHPVPGHARALHNQDKAMQVGILTVCLLLYTLVIFAQLLTLTICSFKGHQSVLWALQWPFESWWSWEPHKWPIRGTHADLQFWSEGCRIP